MSIRVTHTLVASVGLGASMLVAGCMQLSAGSYVGQVVDAETHRPIAGAYVIANWQSPTIIRGGGCADGALARTNETGRYQLPSQRLNSRSLAHSVSAATGTLSAWAPGYAPWRFYNNPSKDVAGNPGFLPNAPIAGSVALATITLQPTHHPFSLTESGEIDSTCLEGEDRAGFAYVLYRTGWHAACDQGRSLETLKAEDIVGLHAELANIAAAIANQREEHAKVEAALKQGTALNDLLGFRGWAAPMPPLTNETWQKGCAIVDVHVSSLERYIK